MTSDTTQAAYSVLSDKSFLTEPSNAQLLQKQQLDAQAASESRKMLLIAGAVVLAVYLLRKS